MKQRLTPKHLTNKVLDKLYDMGDRLEELPEDIHSLVQKVNNNELEITHKLRGLNDIRNTISHLVVAMIISASTIGSAILVLAGMPPTAWGVSILGFLGFVVSGIMGVVVVLSILRNKRSD